MWSERPQRQIADEGSKEGRWRLISPSATHRLPNPMAAARRCSLLVVAAAAISHGFVLTPLPSTQAAVRLPCRTALAMNAAEGAAPLKKRFTLPNSLVSSWHVGTRIVASPVRLVSAILHVISSCVLSVAHAFDSFAAKMPRTEPPANGWTTTTGRPPRRGHWRLGFGQ